MGMSLNTRRFSPTRNNCLKFSTTPMRRTKGLPHQLYQLSKMLAPDLARTVLSFSGAEDSGQQAKNWLSLKFKSPQMMIPVVYQEVKDLSPARSEAEVPRVSECVLRKIESLSALTKDDNSILPSDVVQAVFRSLYLS